MHPHPRDRWLVPTVLLLVLLQACASAQPRAQYPGAPYIKDFTPFWWYDTVGIAAAHGKGATGKGSTVAIVDTGVVPFHEDLPTIDTGVEFCTGNKGPAEDKTNGHGTELAGIVGGRQKGNATRGIAFEAKVVPYKVVCGTANAVVVYLGINHAVTTMDTNVLLLALGPWPGDVDDAGNSADDLLNLLTSTHPETLFVVASVWEPPYSPRPKWTERSNVLLVAAMTLDRYVASKEVPYNYKTGDIWAPGRDVETASIEPRWDAKPHAQFRMQGTSAAAAIVAGCAALLKPQVQATTRENLGAELKKAVLAATKSTGLPGPRLQCDEGVRR